MCPLMLESLLSCVVISDVSDELDGVGFKGDMARNDVGCDEKTTSVQWSRAMGGDYVHY